MLLPQTSTYARFRSVKSRLALHFLSAFHHRVKIMLTPFEAQLIAWRPRLQRMRSLPALPNFNRNWPIAGNLHNHDHTLRRFLPELYRTARQMNARIDAVTQRLAYSSDATEENGGLPGLSGAYLYDAYLTILQSISTSNCDRDVHLALHSLLENSLQEEEHRINHGRQWLHSRTLLHFRALAEIARQTNSFPIGYILGDFFLSYGADIVMSDDRDYIIQWTSVIHRAPIQPDAKRQCQMIIMESAPDIINTLDRNGSRPAQDLARELLRVGDQFGALDINLRGRNWDRRDRRRLFSHSRSPRRRLNTYRGRTLAGPGDLIRPDSAPGDRNLVVQADRLVQATDELRESVDRLHHLRV